MSVQVIQADDVAPAAAPAGEAGRGGQGSKTFAEFVEEVPRSPEIRDEFRGNPGRLESLRRALLDDEAELTGTVSAERKLWQDAAERAANPRDAVQADKKDEKTLFYRFVFLPMLWVFVTSFGSAALCLFVGFVVASSRPSLASWQPAGLISAAVCAGTFVLDIFLAQGNISWVARRETGAYRAAERLAWTAYADALSKRLLGAARIWINEHPDLSREGNLLQIRPSPGLAEVYNRIYQVPGEASKQLNDLMRQLSGGGTIGLAGPRGAGKTSLIREHVLDDHDESVARRIISLLVPAPVEYQAADFVLLLLGRLSREYLAFRGLKEEGRAALGSWFKRLLRWFRRVLAHRPGQQRSPARDAQPHGGLIAEAREYLRQIRAQQSYTKTAGATLSTPGNIAGASGQYATTSTELARTYPELVRTFVSFLGRVASELYGPEKLEDADGTGGLGPEQPHGYVVIGIDELDKISGVEQAQRFVNELKAILGVPHCYYLISVSDDALAAYEMRGLPVRDAFDSAFDEVIHVRYLDLEGSRQLLKKRVIGMPDPFVFLCHCLSGGLPRDLIRAARHVVTAAGRKPASDTDPSGTNYLDAVCQQLVLEELRRKLDVCWISRPAGRLERAESELLHAIQRLVAYQPGSDEQRIRCDLDTGRALRTKLERIVAGLASDGPQPAGPPPENVAPQVPAPQAPAPGVPAAAGAQEPPAVPELASYLHYLLTLLEVFTPPLSPEGTIRDARGNPASGILLDQLCLARQTLGADPRWAWLTIEEFREKWRLNGRYRYPGDAGGGQDG